MLGFTAQECVNVNKTWEQKLGGPKPVQGYDHIASSRSGGGDSSLKSHSLT